HTAAGLPVRGDEAARAATGREALNTLEALFSELRPSGVGPALGAIAAWASAARQLVPLTPGLVRLRQRLSALEPLAMRSVVEERLASGDVENVAARTIAAVRLSWIEETLGTVTLSDGAEIRRLASRLAEAEYALDHWSRDTSLSAAASRRPSTNVPVPTDSELGRLLRWAGAKRRPPLRKVLAEAPTAVQRLKPCLVMSPLAVAQYLGHQDGSRYRFDVCVVDEASMIPTADVIVALSLGRQAVITGDSRQMPPTAFFDRTVLDSAEDDDDDGDSLTFESILDQASTLLPSRSLLWHYRSRDEALIAFSNAKFYDGRLITFPPPFLRQPTSGVHFIHTPEAVYGRGGSRANPAEAERVVAALAAELAAHPSREIAITAMSIAQQAEINARIEAQAASDPGLSDWLAAGGRAKNLETIQGDECDTMILSLGYGRDAAGKLFMNFGPLARDGGERRLNVAITRARWKSVLVSSIRASDIPAERATAPGALALRDYLDYAERGPAVLAGAVRTSVGAATESPFESALLRELTGAGLRCVPQVGVGTYRVDIGVLRPGSESDFVLGVECDGAAYHSSSSARDRDVIRQLVLENVGWRIHRVWSIAWVCNPDHEIDSILAAYEAALGSPPTASPSQPGLASNSTNFEPADPLRDQFARSALHRESGAGSDAIQLDEAVRALSLALQNNGSMPEADVPALLRDAFGYKRVTRAIRDLAYYALLRCEADGLAHRREGSVFPGRK
ncbi:MAG: AAA domain-containing protein, partial [Dehalococcoidia bacterium]